MKDRSLNFSAFKLSLLLVAVYGLQILTGFEPGFNAEMSEWWKFFTSFFGHSDAEHLFNNLFFIGLFGTIYEMLTDSKVFWSTFIVSAIGANFTAFFFYPNSFIIGASGGAMGLLSALAVFKPKKVGLALGVPAPMYLVLPVYILINFAGVTGVSNVAYEAHLFGLFTGGLIGLWLRENERGYGKKEKELSPKKKRREKKRNDRKNKNKELAEEEKEELELSNWEKKIKKWEKKYMID